MKRNVMRTMSLAFAGIMAAGAFVQGSSIELSADAPIREPYNVYFQGGLTFDHSKMGTLKAIQAIKKMKEENK